jgi:hypothetical protein
MGFRLVNDADGAAGATNMGEGGRSPTAEVGFGLCAALFPGLSKL